MSEADLIEAAQIETAKIVKVYKGKDSKIIEAVKKKVISIEAVKFESFF